MLRHELLRHLHELLQPRTYLEIGVSTGSSLTLSRTRTIGVDPFYSLTREVCCDLHLVRTTSDEFFARRRPLAHFGEPRIDLAFIDGMHLAEYALRDVINTERYCHAASVVVIDDMLPRDVDEAGRGREAAAVRGAWAGDVYKMREIFAAVRPELICLEVDTAPTGTVVLLGLDPSSTALAEAYDALVPGLVVPDPQKVPDEVLTRSRAIDPQRLLDAPIWPELRRLRGAEDDLARTRVSRAVAAAGLTG